jgi:hypothetical protein
MENQQVNEYRVVESAHVKRTIDVSKVIPGADRNGCAMQNLYGILLKRCKTAVNYEAMIRECANTVCYHQHAREANGNEPGS